MSHKYLDFQRKYDEIDSEKLTLAKKESLLSDDLFTWAVSHLTRDRREEIIQACIDKSLPQWHIEDLKLTNIRWEEARDKITKLDIDLFCLTEIHYLNYVDASESKATRFYNWFSKGDDKK